ncbi:MAG: prepilin-type N-terminal cleavage/methylation domain-containing protein [Rhodocyclaceae bacterium]|nr:prepilin-type N-terminal cleavage/methylation domain-containing protein [Rhodocyclaceae bacterium]
MANRQTGFTLVEIAIVLIIIGLMLGGVMKGQELVDNAKVKNLTSDFRNIPIFVFAYQDKFKAIPGDDAAVDAHLGATLCPAAASCKATNGTQGNGAIEGDWSSAAAGDESYRFWQHVRLAGLAAGPTNTADSNYLPHNAVGGLIGVTGGSNSPITTLKGSYVVCSQGILGKFAKQIDIALDDGNTAAGAIQAMPNATPTTAVAAVPTSGTGGIDDATPYTVCMGF